MNIKPADRRRWSHFPDIGCVTCRLGGKRNRQTEVHHLNKGGMAGRERRGHQETIPLCLWCHRGIPPEPFDHAWARLNIGPSLAEGSKPFRARYGTDDELLMLTNKWLIDLDLF
jgi:hypothetical protein